MIVLQAAMAVAVVVVVVVVVMILIVIVMMVVGLMLAVCTAKILALINKNTLAILRAIADINRK